MSSQISDIYSQLRKLQKNEQTDSTKYKEIYEQLRSLQQSSNTMEEEHPFVSLDKDTLKDTISESQIFQVQQQILAYKHLIRNLSIPKDVEKNVFSLSKDQWEIEKERLFQRSLKFYNEKIEKDQELKKLISQKFNNSARRATTNTPAAGATPHSDPANPSAPAAQQVQGDFLNEQSVRWIEKNSYFIEKRKQDINLLISSNCLTEEAKLRITCELKFLESLPFYVRLKDTVLLDFKQSDTSMRVFEKNFLDRSYFKREKPAKKQEARMMEKFELHIKNEQENRKRIRHKEFLTQLFSHQADFFEFHKRKYKQMKKRGQHARNFLEQAEKREQEKRDKELKERVKALKSHHFDDYLDLVQKAKNHRILELLQQTDDFLRQIGAKVKVQKGEIQDDNADTEIKSKEEDLAMNLKNSNKIYYNVTHTVKEEVTEQPNLLEGGTLKRYQMIGLQWMVSLYNNKLNGILADEMGLGKTIQTISLFCYLMEFKKNFGPFLIIVPLTTLSNWVMEFDKWAPSIKKIIYKGSPQARKNIGHSLKNTKWNVCVTTYEYILKDRLVLNKFQWQYVVIDEGHRMKNARSKFASTLGQQYTSEHRLLLTGTPLQNNLGELWSLLNFLLPKVFNSCDDFEKWFGLAVNKVTNEKEGQLNEEEQLLIINRLHQVLRPFLLRRVKKEVESEIPNKVEYIIKIELSAWQKLAYEQVKNTGSIVRDPTGKIATKALMNLMMQLRKICNHPFLFLNDDYYTNVNEDIFRTSGKFELLDRILPKLISRRHRVLIFSQMTHLMDILQIYFDYKGFKHLRLDGGTKADERGERMAMFNKEGSEFDIFLLSTRAGGLGLNLQTADTVIIFDSDWNPQMDLQAQDRAHRIGQKSEVRVLRLVTNTWIEEEIIAKAAFKQSLDEILIQAGLYNERSTDSERRAKLEDLLKRKETDDDGDEGIPDDEQINEMLARSEEEIVYFEQLDNERYAREEKLYKHFKWPQKSEGKFFNYRLMQPDEVPSWVQNDVLKEEETKEYGRGNRVKKMVSYVDDDVQWLKSLEDVDQGDDKEDGNDDDAVSKSSEKLGRGGRRPRTNRNATLEDTPQEGRKRTLRKRNTASKTSEMDSVEGDEDRMDDEFNSDQDNGGDDRRYRRLKKVKKNNMAQSELSISESKKDDEEADMEGDESPYVEREADEGMEEETFYQDQE